MKLTRRSFISAAVVFVTFGKVRLPREREFCSLLQTYLNARGLPVTVKPGGNLIVRGPSVIMQPGVEIPPPSWKAIESVIMACRVYPDQAGLLKFLAPWEAWFVKPFSEKINGRNS